jgi:hypothetical protein
MPSAVIGSLRAVLEAATAAFKTDLGSAGAAVDGFTRKTKNSSKQIKDQSDGFAAFVRGGVWAALGTAMALGAKESLSLAGSLEELRGKSEALFGSSAQGVSAWVDRTAKDLGRARVDLAGFVTEFGEIFSEASDTEANAAKLSQAFSELTLDVAAFYEVSSSDASQKLNAALMGSTRGLKSLGITMSETEIENEALRLGLAATKDEISDSDKVIARASLMLDKFRKVQGAAAGDMAGYDGQMEQFSSNLRELATVIGEILLPVANALLGVINNTLSAIAGNNKGFNDGIEVLKFHTLQMIGQGEAAEELARQWRENEAAMAAAEAEAKDLTAAFGSVTEAPDPAQLRKLENELNKVTEAAYQASITVGEFGVPDTQKEWEQLDALGTQFHNISFQLQEQIRSLEEAEGGSSRYASTIATLNGLLTTLSLKYEVATDAGLKLFEAQQALARAGLDSALAGMDQQTQSLSTARGDIGLLTDNQRELIDLENQLAMERVRGVENMRAMEADRAAAEMENNLSRVAELDALILAQGEYNALVRATTAEQLQGQRVLEEMVSEWRQTTSDTVSDFFKAWRDSSDSNSEEIVANFFRSMSDSILNRKADELTDQLFEWLGLGEKKPNQEVGVLNAGMLNVQAGLGNLGGGGMPAAPGGGEPAGDIWSWLATEGAKTFAGFFAEGGTLAPGEWGVGGEAGPEILRGGRHGLTVEPVGNGSGEITQNWYIATPNADSFRPTMRQTAQEARRALR